MRDLTDSEVRTVHDAADTLVSELIETLSEIDELSAIAEDITEDGDEPLDVDTYVRNLVVQTVIAELQALMHQFR